MKIDNDQLVIRYKIIILDCFEAFFMKIYKKKKKV